MRTRSRLRVDTKPSSSSLPARPAKGRSGAAVSLAASIVPFLTGPLTCTSRPTARPWAAGLRTATRSPCTSMALGVTRVIGPFTCGTAPMAAGSTRVTRTLPLARRRPLMATGAPAAIARWSAAMCLGETTRRCPSTSACPAPGSMRPTGPTAAWITSIERALRWLPCATASIATTWPTASLLASIALLPELTGVLPSYSTSRPLTHTLAKPVTTPTMPVPPVPPSPTAGLPVPPMPPSPTAGLPVPPMPPSPTAGLPVPPMPPS